ncbi:hypothetical protein OIU77_007105 [Salix suchowensis]|uniref:Uncharacterized protein n=1 Tax=Salix suchowensis TaxID=1278906 RepID=A0ABQ9AP52_9ROSI|nr:hypothetical protein OIU77_007105 [Salix suchowensis]
MYADKRRPQIAGIGTLAWNNHILTTGVNGWSDPLPRTLLRLTEGIHKRFVGLNGAFLISIDTGSQVCALLWNKNERELLSSLWVYAESTHCLEISINGENGRSLNGHTFLEFYGNTLESFTWLRFWNVFGVPEMAAAKPAPEANPEPFSHSDSASR